MSGNTTRAISHATGPRIQLALAVIEGSDAGRTVPVDGPVLLGTSEHCDVQLDDPTVSRRHALVSPSEEGLRIVDQDSRNGIWIADCRVRDAEVGEGALVRMGSTVLRVEQREASEPEAEPAGEHTKFGRFCGESAVLQPMYDRLLRASATDVTILLEGESGSGKELLAEGIHDHSARSDGPFVVVDCGAVAQALIESELFGHERGAFTGADRARTGAFERASGGTIFLDEIGELPLAMQTRLLRVLDRKHVQRVGSSERVSVDVRVIAATNRNLEREVEESRFRLDLFHRLAVVLVRVPALRDREGDAELLAAHFIGAFGGNASVLTDEARSHLGVHSWPGNVRELRNYVERLVVLGEGLLDLKPSDQTLRSFVSQNLPYRQTRAQVLEAFTGLYVEEMLRRHGGNVSHAAEEAGVARRHFQRLKAR